MAEAVSHRDKIRAVMQSRNYLVAEFILLCIVVPGIIMYNVWARHMFGFLWAASAYGLFVMMFVYRDKIKGIWRWEAVTKDAIKPILVRWVFACIFMTVFLYFYNPDRLFILFETYPQIILPLLLLYPLISALPQEFIFCSYFFERFKSFFGEGKLMVWMSTIIFAYAHCMYINPVAPTLSLFAGYIFATTYLKTKSLAMVTIEHGLYGNFLFLVGLGYYFHGGSVN